MKKVLFYSLFAAVVAVACEKEIIPTKSEPANANLTCVVRCNLDITNDTNQFGRYEQQLDFVPNGTRVHFTVSGKDLQVNPVNGYNYQDVVVSGVVGDNGELKMSIPVGANGSSVLIQGDEFEADFTYLDFDRDNKPISLYRKEAFKLNSLNLVLKPGFNTLQNLNYVKK